LATTFFILVLAVSQSSRLVISVFWEVWLDRQADSARTIESFPLPTLRQTGYNDGSTVYGRFFTSNTRLGFGQCADVSLSSQKDEGPHHALSHSVKQLLPF
jgi:hypothetical protein